MTKYIVEAERDGRWWIVIGTGPLKGVFTQAKTLDELEGRMLPDAIALLMDVPKDSFEVEVRVKLPHVLGDQIREMQEARAQAEVAQRDATQALAAVVPQVLAQGLTLRDAARVLGVSHQRVAQLARAAA